MEKLTEDCGDAGRRVLPFSRSTKEVEGGEYGGRDVSGVEGNLLPQLDLCIIIISQMYADNSTHK